MNTNELTVHVVDDDDMFRTAVVRLLQRGGYKVIEYSSGDSLLENPNHMEPGCILLDVRMTGLSGLQLQERLNALDSFLPIIFLTGHGDIPMTVHAIKAGAHDFLSKPVDRKTLFAAINRALERYEEQRKERAKFKALQERLDTLTPREREVYGLMVRGRLNKQIAFELGTSERTIKAHRHSIMQKLQVQSLAEAVSIAERLDMLGGDAQSLVRQDSRQA
jgi:FixJ family two-component response regulator